MGETNESMAMGGSTWIWVFFLFFLLAAGGSGFGFFGNGGNGAMARAEFQNGLYNQTVDANLRGLAEGQCVISNKILESQYDIGSQLSQNRYDIAMQTNAIQTQQMLANTETNRNIDAVRFDNAQNTQAIIAANNCNTQKVLDMLTANSINELRDRLQNEIMEKNNAAQTAALINAIKPCPIPAYITCSPYAVNSACGCGNGYSGYSCNG